MDFKVGDIVKYRYLTCPPHTYMQVVEIRSAESWGSILLVRRLPLSKTESALLVYPIRKVLPSSVELVDV